MASDERQRAVLDGLCRRFDATTDAERIIDSFAAAFRGGPEPVLSDVSALPDLDLAPAQCKDLLDEPVAPRTGPRLPELLDTVFDRALPSGMMHAHPGFMAHVPSGGLFQAAVGEFLARSLNRFAGVWAAAPGFAQIELDVVRWFCNAMGYGENAFGSSRAQAQAGSRSLLRTFDAPSPALYTPCRHNRLTKTSHAEPTPRKPRQTITVESFNTTIAPNRAKPTRRHPDRTGHPDRRPPAASTHRRRPPDPDLEPAMLIS
ncbi:pyridoxal-dependent decarboxylase [Allokutzneria sp. A3M-2-11 16]|uniref:pyridoxal-dependent decarboxylase n=1 Tax=Allokutzneria sp. A3M-2-11 16 TaxID=2962043 RepID=UPI0020B8C57D|nr:pyridoxal-dependent decarboxylase [Allokutzneria sp. A3M-2-11 16]MCP3803468.1 pyridoxal-dependent decarboxylase [Allokutzneria sp. A3M-2-11 16]